jgi:hypothetical protein
MKTILLTLTIFLTFLTLNAQKIKDFYIPASPHNKVTFQMVKIPDMRRIIFYNDKGITCEIMDIKTYLNKTTTNVQKYITFSDNEVKIIKSISTTIKETNKIRTHSTQNILLKMPPQAGTVNWSYISVYGDVYNCTASWTTINIDGKDIRTIQVEQSIIGLTTIEYYVEGIGLYKTDSYSESKAHAFEKFIQLDYDSNVK